MAAERGAGMENKQTVEQKRAVWQRVDPTLDPYPDVRAAAAMAADTSGDGLSAAERNAELSLPGAQADPCCMGTAALESLEVLQGFIREELADRRTYLFLARRAPTAEARQVFRAIASDEGRHARRLLAAVYLITGERYCPAICYPPLRCDGYCAALRERYHEEVCGSKPLSFSSTSSLSGIISSSFERRAVFFITWEILS